MAPDLDLRYGSVRSYTAPVMLFLSIPLAFLRPWLAEAVWPLVLVVQGLEHRIYFAGIQRMTRDS